MKVLDKPGFWLPCIVAISVISTEAIYAQPPSPARGVPSKVGHVPVADVLQRLGAKLERGSVAKDFDSYSSHFDRMDANRDGKHTRAEYVDQGSYMTPQARAGIFRAADGNADGVVTKAEYVLNRIITDEAKAIVQGMDDDEDGLVERAEFVKHAAKLLSDLQLAEQVYAALDANADGGIPIPEYLRVWGQWARVGRKSAEERIAARRVELVEVTNKPEEKPVISIEDFADSLEYLGVAVEKDDTHVWGTSPVIDRDTGMIHLFVAEWDSRGMPFSTAWWHISQIAHYVGDSPEGPFRFVDYVVKDADGTFNSPHNPSVVYLDNKYVLTFIVNEHNDKAHQHIIMYIADSPNGPWRPATGQGDGTILRAPTSPEYWSYK